MMTLGDVNLASLACESKEFIRIEEYKYIFDN
jgi:hypothetical protein